MDGVVEGVSERNVDLSVVLVSRAPDQVEIPEKDPGTSDERRELEEILEERQGGRVVRGAVSICNGEVNIGGGGGDRCRE